MIACPCDHPADGPYLCTMGSQCNPVPEHTCGEDVPARGCRRCSGDAEVGVCGACKEGLLLCQVCRRRPAEDQDPNVNAYCEGHELSLDALCTTCIPVELDRLADLRSPEAAVEALGLSAADYSADDYKALMEALS